jgi:hypothetical protein
LEKSDISDTGTQKLQDDLKEFMALIPTDAVLEIALEYLANDKEVREFIVYVQSEEFPKIHAIVEYLKEYKHVSAFMCMFLKPQFDRENILFTFNWCPYCSFLVCEIHQ